MYMYIIRRDAMQLSSFVLCVKKRIPAGGDSGEDDKKANFLPC